MKTKCISPFLALGLVFHAGLALAEPSPEAAAHSCCSAKLPTAQFTDKSIYQTESKWTTADGKQIKLGDLSGKPQVVAMFFANCQFACPVTVNDMKRIETALKPELRERVGFTLVSFDAKRDTPAALAEYRARHELSVGRWTLVRGEPDDVLELAALLGIKFKQDPAGQFAHSNVIVVLNAQGEIVHQLVGLNQDISETARLLEHLAEK